MISTRAVVALRPSGFLVLRPSHIDAEAEAFHRRFGFESTPAQERQLILQLKDARRFAGR
ncbi:MAG: hypothetical protein ROZ64_11800 [Burkholderiaceae bacterium]|jgi:hypothetical protein|nr:hypothetical protein [Burkholderiaceae bacterium]